MPLKRWFAEKNNTSITLTFKEIEAILGRKLSPSARQHTSRWYTRPDRNAMAEAWVTEGYKLFRLDPEREKLTFHREEDGVSHVKIPGWLTAGKIPDEARAEIEDFFQYIRKKHGIKKHKCKVISILDLCSKNEQLTVHCNVNCNQLKPDFFISAPPS